MSAHCPGCGLPAVEGAASCAKCGFRVPPPSMIESTPAAGAAAPAGGATGLPSRYEVLRFLGSGAMGRVYRCRDAELDVEVAVKVLLPEVAANENAVQMIRREARAAARLRECPGVLSLYGFERAASSWYLVMEYAPEGTLLDRMREKRRIPEADCRRLGAEVAEALAFAHARAVLHRDIKPANILFAGDGRAMVGDFGLSRVFESGGGGPTTVTLAGTPVYMAPEIMLHQGADGRADLYSLGCTLYEAATGEWPFPGSFAKMAVAKSDPLAPVPDPRDVLPELSDSFAEAIRKMLAPEPRRRFADGKACAAALRREQGGA